MPATNEGPARTPALVVDAFELDHYMRELYSPPVGEGRGYTEQFGTKKTDIAPNPGTAITASRIILGGDVRELSGWTIRETTGAAAATIRLRDGNNAQSEVIAVLGLPAAGSSIIFPTARNIEVATGRVFVEVVAGSVEGVIYWR